jgi:hypothetical protein
MEHNRSSKYLEDYTRANSPIFHNILFNSDEKEIIPLVVTIEEKIACNQIVKDCLKGFEGANQPIEHIDTVFIPALRRVLENRGSFDDLALVKPRFLLYEQVCNSGHFGLILAEA